MASNQQDIWSGQFAITSSACALTSASGPALASAGGLLYLAARQSDNHVMFTTSADGKTWNTAPTLIPYMKSAGFSLAGDGSTVHMAFRGADKHDHDLYYMCLTEKGGWSQPVKLSELIDAHSNKAPAIGVIDDQIFIVFKAESSDRLYYTTRALDDDSAAWTKPASLTGSNGGETSQAPALGLCDDKLYVVYRGKSSTRLYYAYFADGLWSGQLDVHVDKKKAEDPESSTRVGLAAVGSRLYMTYKGKDSGNLWSTSFSDGAWAEQTKITGQNNATSESGPALANHQGLIVMVFRDGDSDNLRGCVLTNASRG